MSIESSPQSSNPSDRSRHEALLELVQRAGIEERAAAEQANRLQSPRERTQTAAPSEESAATATERAKRYGSSLRWLGALAATIALGVGAGIVDKATTTTECRDGRIDQGGSVVGTVQEVVANAGWQPSFDTETIAAAHSAAREIDGSVHPGDRVEVCYTESVLPLSGHITAKVTQK